MGGSAVFIRALPKEASAHTLSGMFSAAGHVVSAQVDQGPLTTATVAFAREDDALQAAEQFHGQVMQGAKIKVAVKEHQERPNGGDDDFWKKELAMMPPRRSQLLDIEWNDEKENNQELRNGDGDDWGKQVPLQPRRGLLDPD